MIRRPLDNHTTAHAFLARGAAERSEASSRDTWSERKRAVTVGRSPRKSLALSGGALPSATRPEPQRGEGPSVPLTGRPCRSDSMRHLHVSARRGGRERSFVQASSRSRAHSPARLPPGQPAGPPTGELGTESVRTHAARTREITGGVAGGRRRHRARVDIITHTRGDIGVGGPKWCRPTSQNERRQWQIASVTLCLPAVPCYT